MWMLISYKYNCEESYDIQPSDSIEIYNSYCE